MNIRFFIGLIIVLALSSNSFSSFADLTQPASIGEVVALKIIPQLEDAEDKSQFSRWSTTIHQKDTGFIKIHFEDFNLEPGDSVKIVSLSGRVIETLTGMGPKSSMKFWSLSAPGDTVNVEFQYRGQYQSAPPFTVDRIAKGHLLSDSVGHSDDAFASRTICQPPDWQDSTCFLNDPDKAAGINASVGIMYIDYQGGGEDVLGCSGSTVSANSNIMTNNHCLTHQQVCDNAEVVYQYRRNSCDPNAPLDNWVSYRCDELLVTSLPNQESLCGALPGLVDMSLLSIVGDPAEDFGFLELESGPITSGLNVYQVHHPRPNLANQPQQVTTGGGSDVYVDGGALRYYNTMDTLPGSSGSPVISESTNKIVALHACGRCLDDSLRNAGALSSLIVPLIDEYTCGDSLKMNFGKVTDLMELVGNGNGSIDPGESWSFVMRAVNNSCDTDGTGVNSEIMLNASVTENITINTDNVEFGDLNAREIAASTVTFSVPADASCGSQVSFDFLKLQDVNLTQFPPVLNALVAPIGSTTQTVLFSEGFDLGLGGWTIADGGSNVDGSSTWAIPVSIGGPVNVFALPYYRVSSDDNANDLMDESLISPVLDLSAFTNATLKFTHDFRFRADNATQEKGSVDIRSSLTNDLWVSVESYAEENHSGTEAIDITPYKANNVQIRFRYYDAQDDLHWSVDDIYILGDDGAICDVFSSDTDGDGVPDNFDNCLTVANPDQRDTNQDGYGNICDPDIDNNGVTNFFDVTAWTPFFETAWDGDEDFNGDGFVNFLDYVILGAYFSNNNSAPGPSGIAP